MIRLLDRLANERRRLVSGPAADERPGGLGTVRFVACSQGNSADVILNAKTVLNVVNQVSRGAWPSGDGWRSVLPQWFVARCAPEMTVEEAEKEMARRKRLPRHEQDRAARENWSLLNWLYWFTPDNRYWYWWDAKPLDDHVLAVAVEAYDWPLPWGALAWLLLASGAYRVESEEDVLAHRPSQ